MVFFFIIFIVELCLKAKFLEVLKHAITILAISLIVISPWIYRNIKLIGQFTTISNNQGIVLYINNNSQNKSGVWMDDKNVENSIVNKKEYITANATEKNKMLSLAAKKWILNHPARFVQLGFKRLFNTYIGGSDIDYSLNGTNLNPIFRSFVVVYGYIVKYLIFISATIMMLIYTIKAVNNLIHKRDINKYSIYNLICFYMFACVYFISEGQPRYSFPSIFIMIYFFSYLVEKFYYHKCL